MYKYTPGGDENYNNTRPPATSPHWHPTELPPASYTGSGGGGGGGGGGHHDSYYPPTQGGSYSGQLPSSQISDTKWMPPLSERNTFNESSMVTPAGRYATSTTTHGGGVGGGGLEATDARTEFFPTDPREWTSVDVKRWIQWASMTFKIRNLHADRFQMNGKALCLMDLSMFMYREPESGEKLYKDFQNRLQKAMVHDNGR